MAAPENRIVRILWCVFLVLGVSYEVMWFWDYFAAHSAGLYNGIGFNGFHPWYYGFLGALYILGIIRLYPLARDYDQMGEE